MSALIIDTPIPAKPIIGYDNLMRYAGATVTASSEAAGFPHENAYDWNPTTSWLPSNGTQYLQTVLTTAQVADYFACYGQTLFANGGTIQLQYSLDGGTTYLPAFAPIAPADNSPIIVTFDAIQADRWRVVVVCSPASFLSVVAFGARMTFERGFFVGFSPPIASRMDEITNNVTMNGTFVGRSLLATGIKGSMSLDLLSQNWIRSVWVPFTQHAKLRPWFLYWNKDQWPYETAFCWTDGPIPSAKNTKAGKGFMGTSLNYAGNIE